MSERGGFVSRWSRRKRAARPAAEPLRGPAGAGAQEPEILEPEAKGVVPPADAGESSLAAGADAPGLSPEELARLPRLDDLTADSDVTMFLRAGVPEPLRNAALRRAWALDPKIRNYVSEAREYAYDWNRPGDVPGNGPLPPGFDVKALVGRLFQDRSAMAPPEPAAAPHQAATSPAPDEVSLPDDPASTYSASAGTTVALPQAEASGAASPSAVPTLSDSHPVTATVAPSGTQPDALRKHRHGGAIPL